MLIVLEFEDRDVSILIDWFRNGSCTGFTLKLNSTVFSDYKIFFEIFLLTFVLLFRKISAPCAYEETFLLFDSNEFSVGERGLSSGEQ